MKTPTLLTSLLCLAACGPTEIADEGQRVGVVRQAGKTDQGKTDQGKTDQGSTTGTRLVVNRGSWRIRTASPATYVTAWGDLSLDPFGLTPGNQLIGRSGTTTWNVATTPFRYDQDGSWRYDLYSGLYVQNGQPIATMIAHELSSSGAMSTPRDLRVVNTSLDNGPWNNPAVGYWDSANMLDAAYRTRMNPYLGSNPAGPANADLRFYKVQIRSKTNPAQWDDLCQSSGPGNKAMFMPGYFDASGNYIKHAQYMGVTCWDGTAAKCMRWGYRPWRTLPHPGAPAGSASLEPLFRACVRAARADYCGNGVSFTEAGREIDLWDRYGFITKTGESTRWTDANGRAEAFSDESAFDAQGAVCLVRERLYNTDFTSAVCPMTSTFVNGGEYCVEPTGSGSWSACGPKGLVSSPTNIFDRGSLSTCDVVATRPPLIYVASYDSGCSSHPPTETGRALGSDCNCLTKAVCSTPGNSPWIGKLRPHPWKECCAEDSNGHLIDGKWDVACMQKAIEILSAPGDAALCPIDTVQ